jgi:hypothetical protein
MAEPSEISGRINDEVAAALDELDPMARVRRMSETIRDAFMIAFDDLTPAGADVADAADAFVGSMQNMMMLTHPDGSEEQAARISGIIATAAVNAAAVAANPGAAKTWITKRDDRVRELHVPMEGVTVGSLDTFDVGGFQLQYPGQPVGPPDVWINCRCSLSLGAALTSGGEMDSDALAAAISEEPWSNFTAADYTLEQWRRACIITMPGGDPESKSTYKVPIKTPSGALSRAGVHAAAAALAGARGGVDAPAEQKAKARARLRSAYKQLGDTPPDSLKADAFEPSDIDPAAVVSAPGTHDGPGWLTNPRETQKLRDYWTRGAGAGKIRWGAPGDFDRCRSQLRKYVGGPYLEGTCANLHYVALGFWPNQGPHAGKHHHASVDPVNEEFNAVTAAFTAADTALNHSHSFNGDHDHQLIAAAPTTLLPDPTWFENPGLDGPTPLTVTDDGRVVGHLATFDTCHVGVSGSCQLPPRSQHDYAYFRTGEVVTSAGAIPVGQITMDTGHAGTDLGPNETVRHYDDTGTVVADVAAGEDEYGIWVAGMVRPGATDAQMRTLRAGALSGDWRRIGGNLELVAALVVNVPGFPIPRTQVASAGGHEYAMVAAAVVTVDPNAVDADRVAIAVLAAMDQRAVDAKRRDRAVDLTAAITDLRVNALAAAVEG